MPLSRMSQQRPPFGGLPGRSRITYSTGASCRRSTVTRYNLASQKEMPYDQDLAYIHDAGFTDLARNAAAVVLKLLRNHKLQNGLIVDLGCGSGVLAERLTRAGYNVLGVDISESMLKLARK